MNKQNFDYNNFTSYYPYGELPLKYTKQGQQKIKNELENNSSSAFFNFKTNNDNSKDKSNETKKVESQENKDKVNKDEVNNSNNIDIKSLLPLLSNFSGNDKIKQLIPLITKGDNLNMNDLIKLFSNTQKQTSTPTTASFEDNNYISSLKKVE